MPHLIVGNTMHPREVRILGGAYLLLEESPRGERVRESKRLERERDRNKKGEIRRAQERFGEILALFEKDVERLPDSDEEQAVDQSLARAATLIAVRRHSGRTETVYTVMGPAVAQHGKDLSGVAAVIGTGGVLVHGNDPARILAKACADPNDPESLRPRAPRLLLDRGYLLLSLIHISEPTRH